VAVSGDPGPPARVAAVETGDAPRYALEVLAEAVAAGHRRADDPDVPVVLVAGRLSGRVAPGAARCAAVGLSPLSGGVAETRAEGPFGGRMRAAGADALVLTGRAERPSYVVVRNGSATLHDAGDLWGLDTGAATDRLAARYGSEAGVAVVGPAGERGARYASVVTARHFPLPRLGFGAVLGARNLKAVVCLGDRPAPVADPAGLATVAAAYRDAQPRNALARWQHDEPGFGVWPGDLTEPGQCAVRNFADTATLPVGGLRPDRFVGGWSPGCPYCPTDCVKVFDGAGLHQEAVAALGPNLGIDDPATVLAANAACQRLGLDPASAGGALGCLFEAAERGLVPWRTPVPLGFGAAGSLVPLLELIAYGDGDLAEALRGGAAELARRLGAPELAMTVRGVELPPFDPRVQPGLGLGYVAAPVGPRYDICEHDLDFDVADGDPSCYPEARRLGLTVPEPAGRLDAARADRTAVLMALWSGLDALLLCPYASTPTRPLSLALIGDLTEAVTGTRLGRDELLALGRDRFRRQEAINAALGLPVPELLPRRLHTEPVAAGRYAGSVLEPTAFAAVVARLRTRLDLDSEGKTNG
jgi:aldehyde:ferredoxin oxidoreductase